MGGAAIKWSLSNTSVVQTCAQAGVTDVYIDFIDSNSNPVYGGMGDKASCTQPAAIYSYLKPGNYSVKVTATGTAGTYQSNFLSPPVVTVTAFMFPDAAAATNVIVAR